MSKYTTYQNIMQQAESAAWFARVQAQMRSAVNQAEQAAQSLAVRQAQRAQYTDLYTALGITQDEITELATMGTKVQAFVEDMKTNHHAALGYPDPSTLE